MLKRRIIPRLEVRSGRVVKGVHFKGLRDSGDPVEATRAYDRQGADEIVLLDISSTSEGRETFLGVVARVAAQLFVPLTVGGGIRRDDDVRRLIEAGADKVAVNSAAVTSPLLIKRLSERWGSRCIVGAVDVRVMESQPGDAEPLYEVMIHGGTRSTGLDAVAWCDHLVELGVGEIILNSIDRSAAKQGYDIWITQHVARRVGVPVIAGGGVASLEHLREGLAQGEGEADGALAGSIFHFGLHSIAQAKRYLAAQGVPVRPPNQFA